MTPMRIRKQILQVQEEIEQEQEKLDRLKTGPTEAQSVLAAVESRQSAVESLVGFLVGRREQNGFSEAYRIVVPRSDVRERPA